jgi:glycosyltransferase involved in cell wall biosynthesis
LKILQLGKFYPIKGGVEEVMYSIATGVSAHGITCDMLYASTNGEIDTITLNNSCKVYRCRTLLKAKSTMISPAMIFRLRKICKNYDIIHIHHPDPMACLALFLSGYRKKVILHWHSDIIKQKYLLRLYKPLQTWLIRRADLIIGTSPVYLQESPYLKSFQSKTYCVPIGIDGLKAEDEDINLIRESYGNRKIIYSMGRLVGYKGYKYLVDAARYLSDDYIILIGGDGPLRNELQAEIEFYDLHDKVELLGYIPKEKISAYYAACTVFCLSSIEKTEAFAIVQVEAMSLGKPIVATNIKGSGVSWVNEDGVSGINVRPRSGKEIARAVKAICDTHDIYENFCTNARQRYGTFFRKDEMIDKCINVYNNLNERERN